MKISIIIPIYNRLQVTKTGISAIKRSLNIKYSENLLKFNYKIIVVDDGSTDGSSEWISDNHPDIDLLKGNGDLWWSGAVNMGVKYALKKLNSNYVIILNPDNEPDENYFLKLEKVLKNNSNCIIGSKILAMHNSEEWSKLKAFNKYTGISNDSKGDNNYSYKWVTGMGVVVPANIVKTIGYWDANNFPQYFGDTDYCIRASKANFNVICSEELIVFNKTEYSSYIGKDLNTFFKSLNKNNIGSRYNMLIRFKFYKKNCKGPLWIITFLIYYLNYFIRVLIKNNN